jgi:ligand-binding sensor domain-containing protein
MKRCFITIYSLLVLLFLSKENTGQTQQMSFNLISGTNGIHLGKINAITQDKYGFMWFSDQTNRCIVRYDGSYMTSYQNNPDDSNSLGGYYPETFFADSSGVIWIGFGGSGMDSFDPATGIFKHFRHDTSKANSLSSDWVWAILVDHLDNLWVGTNSGLDRIDQKTGKFEHFTYDENDPTSLSHNVVRAIYEDRQGTIWIGTGVPWVHGNEGGLNRFDRSTHTFTRYVNDPNDENSLVNNKVRAILEDSKGNFWIGTSNDGLHTLNRKTGKFTRYLYDPKNPEKLSRPPVRNVWDHITFIAEDADEKLWIGTVGKGINRYDPVTQKITHFGDDANISGTFKDNSGWCAYASDDGLFWLSTQESHLYKIDLYNNTIPHFEVDGAMRSLYNEDPSVLWLSTGSGVVRRNLENGTSKRFVHQPQNTNSLSSNYVRRIIKDHQGIFWIGTSNGLNRYDADSKIFTRFLNNPSDNSSLSDNDISFLYEDQDLNLWVGTYRGGLNLLNRNTGKFTRFQNDIADKNSIGNGAVTALLEGSKNELWLGLSFNAGVNKLDRKTGTFRHYFSGHSVNDLFKDSDGIIWVGTESGLYSYDNSTGEINPANEESTGISKNAFIISVIGDNESNLWISTLTGIYKLNKNRDHFIHFGKESGIKTRDEDRLVTGASYRGHDGKLFFCDRDGYYSFYPAKLKSLSDTSKLYFTNFLVNGNSVIPGDGSPLHQPLLNTDKIKLDYNQNVLSFNFTAIEYRKPGDNTIYYKLENYDNDWRQTNAEDRVTYFKIPPGEYIFRIKTANTNSGRWSEKSMAIIISPPWWATWWFRLSAIILLATTFYLLIRWWLHRKFRLQLEHTQKEKQLAELNQKAAELEMQALRAQMNPHFIFNSLNSINMFILENNNLQASEYLSKFSRLVRLILQNSQEAFIPLEKELEALQLYLELEALRFENKFEYKITVDEDIDTTVLKVPPLIIQPYAENAIWHGLMHKQEKGYLEIEIYQQEEVLFCKITDDGIGRKRAAELKSKSGTIQKSLGMRITADRIAMLHQQNKTFITITDLVLADGNPGGTEVLIEIPVHYD